MMRPLLVGLALLSLIPVIAANDRELEKPGLSNGEFLRKRHGITEDLSRGLQTDGGPVSPTPAPGATSSLTTTSDTWICSNGISGIESSNGLACCVVGCGQCGGVGCSAVGLPDYDADDCCSTEIVDFGMSCSVTGSAPCYIDDDGPVCSNGVNGMESTDGTICCASECDECSEDACSLSLSFGSDGDSECCSSDIVSFGELCDSTGTAPCIISEVASTCSNGIIGIESSNGEACCVAACGQCGGVGCSSAGLPNYNAFDCCVTEIVDFGMSCSETGSAPCAIDDEVTVSPDEISDTIISVCSNGFLGIQSSDGLACCVMECGQCDDVGCSTVGLPDHGAGDCCPTEIVENGLSCGNTTEAPCYSEGITVSSGMPTSAPSELIIGTLSPDEISDSIISVCSNGFPGIQSSDELACCVTECGQCDDVGCSTVGLPDHGAEDCCPTEIVENGVSCGNTTEAPCYSAGITVSSGMPTSAPSELTIAVTVSPDEISDTIISVCSNGFLGIQSSDALACCVTECGQCDDVGCSTIGLPDHGAEDCCPTEIVENGVSCGDTTEAPCYLTGITMPSNIPTPAPSELAIGTSSPAIAIVGIVFVCSNGYPGVESSNGLACCVAGCGQCGGVGCSTVGLPDYDADDCCSTEIMDFGVSCEDTDSAPCYLPQAAVDSVSCVTTFEYDGCYAEEVEDPFSSKIGSANMTPDVCFATCSEENALYMGLIGGNECACGEDNSYLLSNKTEGSCTSVCDGDVTQTCGGPLAFDLYTITEVCG